MGALLARSSVLRRATCQRADLELSVEMKPEPVVAKWEMWSVANMLISVHGDGAEAHAAAKLVDAQERQHEGDEIVWQGILTQLSRIRDGKCTTE